MITSSSRSSRSSRSFALSALILVLSFTATPVLADGEITIGDCEEGDAPSEYIASCDQVCVDSTSDHDLLCTLPSISSPTDTGKMWAVTGYTSDHTFSVWGQDESGTTFCCVVDNNGLNPDNVDLQGGSGDDELYFTHDESGTYLGAYSTADGVKGGISGGDGDDTIVGSESEIDYTDTLSGEQGADTIDGRAGDDRLFADGRHSYSTADTSINILNGGDGEDDLFGAEGDDVLSGDADDDSLYGMEGDDTLSGGAGADLLYGDDWSGTCDSATDGNDTLSGGTEDDTLKGCDGTDTLYGDGGDDTLKGNGDGDWLYGGDGNDTIRGGDGNDTIEGGIGNDILSGGADVDSMRGDAGNDTLCDEHAGDQFFGGTGSDKLWFGGTASPGFSLAGSHHFATDECANLGYWWAGYGASGMRGMCSYSLTSAPTDCP